MSAPNKSFFSGLTGLITGIAGIVTAAAALFGVAANQGWLRSSSTSNAKPGATSGAATSQTTGGAAGPTGTTGSTSSATPRYAVDPSSIVFQPIGATTASVKVSNTGEVPLTVEPPSVTGDTSHFSASDHTCGSSVDPGRSCLLQVTFNKAPGTFTATLVVQVTGATRSTKVPIKATAIL